MIIHRNFDDAVENGDLVRWERIAVACDRLLERLRKFHPEKENGAPAAKPDAVITGSGSGELGHRLKPKRPTGFDPRRFHQTTSSPKVGRHVGY
jgi:hypothetical protein